MARRATLESDSYDPDDYESRVDTYRSIEKDMGKYQASPKLTTKDKSNLRIAVTMGRKSKLFHSLDRFENFMKAESAYPGRRKEDKAARAIWGDLREHRPRISVIVVTPGKKGISLKQVLKTYEPEEE